MIKLVFFVLVLVALCELRGVCQNPIPPEFEAKINSGWLPQICAKQGNLEMPAPAICLWAEKRAGDRVRILFICDSGHQYEALSIAKSFDLDIDIVPIWQAYANRENDLDPDTSNLLRYYLKSRHYAAIAMAGCWLSAIPEDCAEKIASLITQDGVGMVYALPGIFPRVPALAGKPSKWLTPLQALTTPGSAYGARTYKILPAGDHPLSTRCNFNAIMWASDTDSSITDGATAILQSENPNRVMAGAALRGKGRVVSYNRSFNENSYGYPFLPVPYGFPETPGEDMEKANGKFSRWMTGMDYADQFYSWLGHAILWSANKEASVRISKMTVIGNNLVINLESDGISNSTIKLHGSVLSSYGSIEKQFSTSSKASKVVEYKLPKTGCTGIQKINLQLLDESNRVLDWGSISNTVAGKLDITLTTDTSLHKPSDIIPVSLEIRNIKTAGTLKVSTRLLDTNGRLLYKKSDSYPVKTGNSKIVENINLASTGITTRLANLQVLVTNGTETTELRDQLFISQSPEFDKLHIMGYIGSDINADPQFDVLSRCMKETGHDTLLAGWPTSMKMRLNAETSMRSVANNIGLYCGYDQNKLKNLTSWLRNFSPVMYELQDEPELQFTPTTEARFDSPADMDRFIKSLKTKYTTLQSLNAAWNRDFKDWGDIGRALWYETINTDNWSAWFDSRRDLDTVLPDKFVSSLNAIRTVEPSADCNINYRSLDTLGGCDARQMARKLPAVSLYTFFCAVPPMGYLEFAGGWSDRIQSCLGYTWTCEPGPKRIIREAWDAVRRGAGTITWFMPYFDESPPNSRWSYFNADFTINEKGRAINEVNKKLLSGPGHIAAAAKPVREGVFVYYPRSSFYTNTLAHMNKQLTADPSADVTKLTGLGPWMEQLPNSFVPLLRAMGFQYEFGDEYDLTAERLSKTRIVLLSHVICLGEEHLKLLRDFVKNGGVIIAESGTARRDMDGRIYKTSPELFKEIFGVERKSANLSPVVESDNVTTCGAERLNTGSTNPVYRNGKAFYVDFPISPDVNGLKVLSNIIELSGVKPTYNISKNPWTTAPAVSLVARKLGSITYLFVTGDADELKSQFTINLPETTNVYEITEGKSMGQVSQISDALSYGDARVYALAESVPEQLKASADHNSYRQGSFVTLNFDCGKNSGDRMIKIDTIERSNIISPAIPHTVILKKGKGRVVFKIPLNFIKENIQLSVTDIASGLKAAISLKVGS